MWRRFATWLVVSIAVLGLSCSSPDRAPSTAEGAGSGSLEEACSGLAFSCEELVQLGFTYPFPRLESSYLFINGASYPYVDVTDDLLGTSTVRQPDGSVMTVAELLEVFGLDPDAEEPQIPVIGYGSNPSPAQLTRKFVDADFDGDAVIPTMKGVLSDYDVVWAPHFVAYGAMPSTIVPSPGTRVEVWINWLDQEELDQMNGSEGSGGLYAFGAFDDVELEIDGPDPSGPKVYVDCFGALEIDGERFAVAAVPATGRTATPLDESQALAAVVPTLGWDQSLFDLLLANVTSPSGRDQRTNQIKVLGDKTEDPRFEPEVACGVDPDQASGGEF